MDNCQTDCRTPDGITVGLIDSIITMARVLKGRDFSSPAAQSALVDLFQDRDLMRLLWLAKRASIANPPGPVNFEREPMKELLKRCAEYFQSMGSRPQPIYDFSPDGYCEDVQQADDHALWMLGQMAELLDAGDCASMDKFNRWLGFVQGVLWVTGMYSLNQLRDQTREAGTKDQEGIKRRNEALTGAD